MLHSQCRGAGVAVSVVAVVGTVELTLAVGGAVVSVGEVAVVVVVTSPPQFSGSFSSGGLFGPDLHPWQGFL